MQTYRSIESIPFFDNSICTVGMFDGVHRGHQLMIRTLLQTAEAKNARPVLITFDPHPVVILTGGLEKVSLLTTTDEKLILFEKMGMTHVLLMPFSKEMAGFTAEHFIRDILLKKIGLSALLVGFNHTLGHDRGTIDMIRQIGSENHFEAIPVPAVNIGSVNVSSTEIRTAIRDGNTELAAEYLGRQYSVSGRVVRGMQIGRKLGFPTANLEVPAEKLVPGDGVYSVLVACNGEEYGGLVNIGHSPTISGKVWGIEIYIDNFKEIIYNKDLKIKFLSRLRDELKFDSIESLKKQIEKDLENARKSFATYIRR